MKNKKNIITTQIIAGIHKGRSLELPSLEVTRSSKSILKESFFNTIQFDIMDAQLVEMFGGSGSIGLEAVSRGAKKVYFFEKNKKSFDVLQRNINAIDSSKCEAYLGDVFENFPNFLKGVDLDSEKFFFYVDPPFSIREGMEDIYDKMIHLLESIPTQIIELLIIEHMTGLELPDSIGDLVLKKSKKFGKTSLSYYQDPKKL